MLNQLTWKVYGETMIALIIIYYAFIIYRFYRPELGRLLAFGQQASDQSNFNVLQFAPETGSVTEITEAEETDAVLDETESFIAAVKLVISAYTDKPEPGRVLPQLQQIFHTHHNLKDSHYRPALNELVVNECDKQGAGTLTEAEVDQWWDQ